jgi:hypothetical protein
MSSTKSGFGWFGMSDVNRLAGEQSLSHMSPAAKELEHVANELCEKALKDARDQLHPLLQNSELEYLAQRVEFIRAFKSALEQRIARKLAAGQPGIEAVFKFEETRTENWQSWDGSIHLLVKVPRLSDALKSLGRKLDRSLVRYFRQLGWSRFQKRQSILEVQQVTSRELRYGIGYGAMFSAVYTVPVKVWPQEKNRSR